MLSHTKTNFEYIEKIMLLCDEPYNYFNFDAVFSDETPLYRTPESPKISDDVEVKIRVGKNNTDEIYLCFDNKKIKAKKCDTNKNFDFFKAKIPNIKDKLYYYFEILKNNEVYYYNKLGVSKHYDYNYNFVVIPGFEVPNWAKGTVMYQIYVDRFFNGDESNDVVDNEYAYLGKAAKKISNWYKPVANEDICNFYGGDLQGVMDKLPYLKDLGIEAIYFNPIFVSPSNHKYDIQDYDYVDPHYGVIAEDGGERLKFEKFKNKYATKYIKRTTDKINLEASNKLMIKLIEKAHKNGIKIILDGVFNHCGAFNKWLDKEGFYRGKNYPDGAYYSRDSIYHDYFKWYDDNWPNNDCYDGWWGHDNHPKLNFEKSKELYDYILDVGRKWVSPPYNADGWRLDVAADLGCSKEFNHKFWRDFRKAVKKANPNAVIYAEHYGDPSEWLWGDQWDSVMNYDAFMEPITWFLTGMEKHSEKYDEGLYCNAENFEAAMRYHMSRFSNQSLSISMNELSNHDHSRFLTRTNHKAGRLHTHGYEEADKDINKGIMKEAVIFQMTWPGAPTVYYGDEAGVTGWTDPDNRRTYPWGREDKELLDFHKAAIKLHKTNSALKTGSVEYLAMDYGVLSFGRWNEKEKIAVVLNNNSVEKTISVPVWKINMENCEKMHSVLFSSESDFDTKERIFVVKDGMIDVVLPPFSSIVVKNKH